MKTPTINAVVLALCLSLPGAWAADVEVTWMDPTCGYFAVALPESPEPEKFGLFSARRLPLPKVGDQLRGDMTAVETELENLRNGDNILVIHWADAKSLDQLVRNTPVQCASKWKNRD